MYWQLQNQNRIQPSCKLYPANLFSWMDFYFVCFEMLECEFISACLIVRILQALVKAVSL